MHAETEPAAIALSRGGTEWKVPGRRGLFEKAAAEYRAKHRLVSRPYRSIEIAGFIRLQLPIGHLRFRGGGSSRNRDQQHKQ